MLLVIGMVSDLTGLFPGFLDSYFSLRHPTRVESSLTIVTMYFQVVSTTQSMSLLSISATTTRSHRTDMRMLTKPMEGRPFTPWAHRQILAKASRLCFVMRETSFIRRS